jgi:hypothetical protein
LIGSLIVIGENKWLHLVSYIAIITTNNMSYEEQYKAIENALEYMISEGMVKKVGKNKFRLKTEAELEQEMLDLLED